MISPYEVPTHQVTITADSPGRVSIAIDGEELRTCTKATLSLDAENAPVLKLALLVLNDIHTDLPAHVVLDKPTRRALAAMGWTPPQDDPVTGPAAEAA
jgi:hypothetical protein